MRHHFTVFAALGALLLNGCFFFRGFDPYDEEPVEDPYVYDYTVDAELQDAWVGGDMADLGAFEGDAYEATYSGSQITLHAGQEGGDDFGWAMIRLSTYEEGGFEGPAFEPGTTMSQEDSPSLDAQGCTGPSHGNYVFDGHAAQVEIVVEPGPTETSRLFHYTAVYDQAGGGETHGSFVLEVN